MSTLEADVITAATTDGDLAITGNGTGVPDLEAGTKLNGVALGTAATKNTGTANGDVVVLDATGLPAVDGSQLTGVGGGMGALLEVHNISGSPTIVTLTSFDAATYDSYVILVENVNAASVSVSNFYMRTSTDGGSTYDSGATDYDWVFRSMLANTVNKEKGSTGASYISLADVSQIEGGVANLNLNSTITLFKPSEITYTTVKYETAYYDSTAVFATGGGAGVRKSAADVDAVSFAFDTGGFSNQGSIKLYGLVKAV